MMKKAVSLAILPVAAAFAISGAGLSAMDDHGADMPDATEFNPMQRYAITYDNPRDIAQFYLNDYGVSLSQTDVTTMQDPDNVSIRVMLVTLDGIRDDAVQGLQWRFALRTSEGSWEAAEAGVRRKCYRGDNAGEWTKDICP